MIVVIICLDVNKSRLRYVMQIHRIYAEKTWRDKLDFPDKLKDLEPLWNPSQQFVPKTKLCIFYTLKIALAAIYSSLDEFHLYLRNLFFILERQMIEPPNDWDSKWLNIIVSPPPVCNRHMRRDVCQSFVHCWCPSISTATSRYHSKQPTSYMQ